MCHNISNILKKKVVVFDGAMGTMLVKSGLSPGTYGDEANLSNPKAVSKIHHDYLAAGSDIILTNTFGSSRVALADHGLADKVSKINRAAVAIARREAEAASTKGQPRFVAGEIGPTSKLPSLGQITFDELFFAYEEQVSDLIGAGVDAIAIGTCQDPLQVKAAASAAREVMQKMGRRLPLFISVTVEKNGTMLLGTELSAALATAAPYAPDAFGLNCATGPDAMREHLFYLSNSSPFPISCRPNAGIPENVDGQAAYPLDADEFADALSGYVGEYGILFVGGCCGTTPDHIARLVEKLKQVRRLQDKKKKRSFVSLAAVSSLYSSFDLDQEPSPFVVAEQTNVNGSKKFRDLLLKENFDGMADIAQKAAKSSHALDVCVAYAGRDETLDVKELLCRVAGKSTAAIMIDSTNPATIEAALKIVPGRAIINSINLEDGGEKAKKILTLARKFGALVVALTIDENGMARTAREKLGVAERLVDLCLSCGILRDSILLDVLTFTLASGDESLKNAGKETLDAVRRVQRELGVRTILGVSNISFGLVPRARRVVTSVFLDRAVKAGLAAAIINQSKILPEALIPKNELDLAVRLIDNDQSKGDPLKNILEYFSRQSAQTNAQGISLSPAGTPEEEVKRCVMEGRMSGLKTPIEELIKRMPASEIINCTLLPAMQEVGRLFADGKMPLPFVLDSAEAMRAAIDILAPYMDVDKPPEKATIILATVRGDVHDIGKNLVDAILSNNGYRVVNLGIKQPVQSIIMAVREHSADAIGLSGLLVSSTEIMKEDLMIMEKEGVHIPVLLGGAALTNTFVENTLSKVYSGRLYYCADAFSGLNAMNSLRKK